MRFLFKTLIVITGILMLVPMGAQAGLITYTIDFNSFSNGDSLNNVLLGGGFEYTSVFGDIQKARDIGGGNMVVAVDNNPSDAYGASQILRHTDGFVFDVLSFDIADLTNNPLGGGGSGGLSGSGFRIGFTGNGGDTQYSPTSSTFTTIDVSGNSIFQGLGSLGVNIVSYIPYDNFAIDNIVVQYTAPVPEPATILLLGSGLIGLAGFRRKKKSKRLVVSF